MLVACLPSTALSNPQPRNNNQPSLEQANRDERDESATGHTTRRASPSPAPGHIGIRPGALANVIWASAQVEQPNGRHGTLRHVSLQGDNTPRTPPQCQSRQGLGPSAGEQPAVHPLINQRQASILRCLNLFAHVKSTFHPPSPSHIPHPTHTIPSHPIHKSTTTLRRRLLVVVCVGVLARGLCGPLPSVRSATGLHGRFFASELQAQLNTFQLSQRWPRPHHLSSQQLSSAICGCIFFFRARQRA